MRMNRSSWVLCVCAAVALSACGDDGSENANENENADGANENDNGNANGNENGNDNGNDNGNAACGEGVTLDEMATADTQLLNCDALGALQVPIRVTLSAKPLDAVTAGGTTDFEIQIALEIAEAAVGTIGALAPVATIDEASVDVDAGMGTATATVAATAPCDADFTLDPDENGSAGPVFIAAPAVTQSYTESEGAISLEVTEVTFSIAPPPAPITLSTSGAMPACVWDGDIPSVSFPVE